tara:strand:- start:45952 stop:46611 length:660 start_codon:yes stop_codon:yes gene_type:complete
MSNNKINTTSKIPNDFIILNHELPEITYRIDYATKENFTGDIVPGYHAKLAYFSSPATNALNNARNNFLKDNFEIIIFDTYRPMQAVKYFYQDWINTPINTELQNIYFPNLTKNDLFEIGYLSKKSTHCRGSTIDMGLINKKTKELIDFGTIFDFFGELSHTENSNITKEQKEMRTYLTKVMSEAGFKNYSMEWWHFTLENEPYPDTYFDFEIKDKNHE